MVQRIANQCAYLAWGGLPLERELECHHDSHETRLSTVMEISDHATALFVGSLDDPRPRGPDLGETRPLDLEPPSLVLGLHAGAQVVERHRGPRSAVDLQRDAVDRDRDHAAVFADPPVPL